MIKILSIPKSHRFHNIYNITVHKNGLNTIKNIKRLFLSEATLNENNLNDFNKNLCLAFESSN